MKIKMAAIDLDGTLLRDDMSISDYSKDIILLQGYYPESGTQGDTHRAGDGTNV